jgi:hypothetical protein
MFAGTNSPQIIPELVKWEQNLNSAGIIDLLMPEILPGESYFYVIQTALNVSKASSITVTDQGGHINVPMLFYDGPPLASPAGTNNQAFHAVVFLNYPTGQIADSIVRFNLNGASFWGVPTWLSAYRVNGAARVEMYYQRPGGTYIGPVPGGRTISYYRGIGGSGFTQPVNQRVTIKTSMVMVTSGNNDMSAYCTNGSGSVTFTQTQSNAFSAGASLSAAVFYRTNFPSEDNTTDTGNLSLFVQSTLSNKLVDIGVITFIG